MEKAICDEKHRRVDYRIETQERRLNNHGDRIDRLEQNGTKLEERLDNLIKQLTNLNTTIKWFMGLMAGSFVGFFFYAVQQGLFK